MPSKIKESNLQKAASQTATTHHELDLHTTPTVPLATPEASTVARAMQSPTSLSRRDIIALQPVIGNQAVMRLLSQQATNNVSRSTDSISHQCNATCRHGSTVQRSFLSGGNALSNGVIQRGFFDRFRRNKKEADTATTAPSSSSAAPASALSAPVAAPASAAPAPNPELTSFMAKTFEKTNFIPKTGIGNFDTKYNPKTGNMDIILKLHFNFLDMTEGAFMAQSKASERKWSIAQQKEWVKDFKKQVLQVWGTMPTITCTKSGFENIKAQPRMVIEEVDASAPSNYTVKVNKSFIDQTSKKLRTAGGSTAVDSDTQTATFQEFDNKDKVNDPRVKKHLSATEEKGNVSPTYVRDHARFSKRAGEIGEILFEEKTSTLAGGMTDQLNAGAKKLAGLSEDSALAKLHPIKVKVGQAAGESKNLVKQRANVIKTALSTNGVEQPQQVEKIDSATPATILEPAAQDAAVKKAYMDNWKRVTVAHEVGHMLGLLDEYCNASSPQLLQKMVDDGRLPINHTVSEATRSKNDSIKTKQANYAELLNDANLPVQDWTSPEAGVAGERSTSLMSGGFQLLTQHYVTVWEALGSLTDGFVSKDQWKLG